MSDPVLGQAYTLVNAILVNLLERDSVAGVERIVMVEIAGIAAW